MTASQLQQLCSFLFTATVFHRTNYKGIIPMRWSSEGVRE